MTEERMRDEIERKSGRVGKGKREVEKERQEKRGRRRGERKRKNESEMEKDREREKRKYRQTYIKTCVPVRNQLRLIIQQNPIIQS